MFVGVWWRLLDELGGSLGLGGARGKSEAVGLDMAGVMFGVLSRWNR